jgi:hypothetical protein
MILSGTTPFVWLIIPVASNFYLFRLGLPSFYEAANIVIISRENLQTCFLFIPSSPLL